jgi:hypothetical protein
MASPLAVIKGLVRELCAEAVARLVACRVMEVAPRSGNAGSTWHGGPVKIALNGPLQWKERTAEPGS